MTNQPLRIALAGLGTVGGGVVRLLDANGALIARRAGQPIEVVAVSARDRTRDRGFDAGRFRWCDDAGELARLDGVDAVVELVGGGDGPALTLARAALANGRHLVTANKAMLAHHGLELAELADVFTPYSFIGHRLAQSMLRPHVATFLDVASAFRSSDLDLEIEQLQINSSSPLVSSTLEQLRLGSTYGVIVLAVQHKSGSMQFNPGADLLIEAGDVLIVMGERPKLKRLEQEKVKINGH